MREVIGPATFLHSGATLLCDTAYWYVDEQLINAIGNVRIIQEGTELSSDKLDYRVDESVAQFRGSVVQLQDKDGNMLRSHYLDYYTRDSVAVFEHGASMRDAEGQIIESVDGSYDSRSRLFTFEGDVNMFTDSVFVKTDRLLYHGDSNVAEFESPVDIWKDGNMLSADRGVYDRAAEVFRFYDNVHALGATQEAWADTLVYERAISDIKMYGDVQLSDLSRGLNGIGRYVHYEDSLARVTLQREAAAVMTVDRRSGGSEGNAGDARAADVEAAVAADTGDVQPGHAGMAFEEAPGHASADSIGRAKRLDDALAPGDSIGRVGRPVDALAAGEAGEVRVARVGGAGIADGGVAQPVSEDVTGLSSGVIALPDSLMPPPVPAKDTVYLGADVLIYRSMRLCDIDPAELSESERRVSEISTDAVSQYRAKAAEEAAKKAEEAQRKADEASGKAAVSKGATGVAAPGAEGMPDAGGIDVGPSPDSEAAPALDSAARDSAPAAESSSIANADSLSLAAVDYSVLAAADSTALAVADSTAFAGADSTATAAAGSSALALTDSTALTVADSTALAVTDSTAIVPPDTAKVGFAYAIGNVKVFSGSMQARCDSLVFFERDSLVRMYIEPIIWNENGRHQYYSDSLTILVADGHIEKANLLDNAFVIIQEDSVSFDQIKATEMMAYFDTTSALSRFDGLGSATAIFYLEENDALATVNKSESKMLSAWFADGELDRVYYFDSPKNSAYPAVQLPSEDRQMRGFRWDPDNRPKSPADITSVRLRETRRAQYEARPKAEFRYTDIYFPGYIDEVRREIALRDSLAKVHPKDSAAPADTARTGALPPDDSLALAVPLDTAAALVPPADSAAVEDSTWVPLEEALSQLAESQPKPTRRELRQQRREARWAELDARDAAKAEAKAAKRREKMLRRAAKIKAANDKQAAKDSVVLERYKARYERKKAREEARAAAKAARETARTAAGQADEEARAAADSAATDSTAPAAPAPAGTPAIPVD